MKKMHRMAALFCAPILSALAFVSLPARAADAPDIEMTWMSIANWYFKIGDQRIVMDSPSR